MDTERQEELCVQAQALMQQGQPDAAAPLFQQILNLNVDHIAAQEGMALACSVAENWDAAGKHFARLIQLQPLHARHYFNLGTLYIRTGDYQKAVDTLRRGLQRDRKNAQGYLSVGVAYRKLNQPALAVSAYKEAVKLSPEFAEAYHNLANVYIDMGNLQQAVQMFRKALILNPELAKSQHGIEHAQAAYTHAKQAESPFGRLVNVDTRAKAVPTMERELTDEERVQDRQQIQALTAELDHLANECLHLLKDVLVRRLHAVQVILTAKEFNSGLHQATQEFREALDRWHDLRQQLRRKVLELRAHEELLSGPVIGDLPST